MSRRKIKKGKISKDSTLFCLPLNQRVSYVASKLKEPRCKAGRWI